MPLQLSGFTSVSENAKITAKLSIPKIKIVTNFKGRVFIPVVGEVRPEAILTFDLSTYSFLKLKWMFSF